MSADPAKLTSALSLTEKLPKAPVQPEPDIQGAPDEVRERLEHYSVSPVSRETPTMLV